MRNLTWLGVVFGLLLMSGAGVSTKAEQSNELVDWENPQVIGRNKEQAHAFIRPYADLDKARTEANSSRIQSLNGKWHFNWVGKPEERPVNFYKPTFDVSQWDKIDVPGNWQTQGYGRPIYTNHPYPFAKDQPRVTTTPPEDYTNYFDRNPVGSYKTRFTLEKGLVNKRIFIEFQGVKSAFYLWLNGKKVGYSQGSMTPAEFELTQYLVDGENDLAVEVYRWSDGSYLEGQDMWRFSGIFRDVNLIARPDVFIRDYQIKTSLTDNYQNAELIIEYQLDTSSPEFDEGRYSVDANIYSPSGELIKTTGNSDGDTNSIKVNLSDVQLWSAETPVLYPLLLMLTKDGDTVMEYIPWQVGFKEVKIENQQLIVNGESIKIRGINRHEHHPRMGRYLDTKTMELDLKLIKQANFNLVRNSHYPNDHRWYRLAEKYGVYILDEANQESHGYKRGNKILGDNPEWKKAHVDRAVSMVHTNKNYSAIIIWSLGNEGGAGQNLMAMRNALLDIDNSRPVFYDADDSVSDIFDRSYRSPQNYKQELAKARAKGKPYMQREYAHAMGNSLGNLKEHWDEIYRHDDYIGASIWDWADQGLARIKNTAMISYSNEPGRLTINPEREVWSYGGDFGDRPTDAEFLLNGIVAPDRTPYPGYYEAKKVQQFIQFRETKDPLKIKISNLHDFISLKDYEINWLIRSASEVLANGKVNLDLPAGESAVYSVPFKLHEIPGSTESFLEFSVLTRANTLWAKQGFEVAKEQFVIKPYVYPQGITAKGDEIVVSEKDGSTLVKAGDVIYSFDTVSGDLVSILTSEGELLARPLTPYFWKPVNNNQGRNEFVQRMVPWLSATDYRHVKPIEVVHHEGNLVEVISNNQLQVNNADLMLRYLVNGNGELQLTMKYQPDEKRTQFQFMPKFGVRLALTSDMNTIDWYGRGPFENYPDRKTAAKIASYSSSLADFQVPYISATDSTNRTDVREVSFSSQKQGLTVQGLQSFNFRAFPYLESDLYSPLEKSMKNDTANMVRRKHYYDLPQRNLINVNLDLAIHGVGGDHSWGARTLDKYHVPADKPLQMGLVINVNPK